MKSSAKSECFSSKMVFKWQEFHGIIDQGNREYFRSVLISGQPIKMFWWIDHLIVMFLITFSGHYWHFSGPHLWCNDRTRVSGLGSREDKNSFPRPWLWGDTLTSLTSVTCHHMTHTLRGKTVSVTKLSTQTLTILKTTEMSIYPSLSLLCPDKTCLFGNVKWMLLLKACPLALLYNHHSWRPSQSGDNYEHCIVSSSSPG